MLIEPSTGIGGEFVVVDLFSFRNKVYYERGANRKKQGSVSSALWVDPIYLGGGVGLGLRKGHN